MVPTMPGCSSWRSPPCSTWRAPQGSSSLQASGSDCSLAKCLKNQVISEKWLRNSFSETIRNGWETISEKHVSEKSFPKHFSETIGNGF
jgi:hypothetical protein